MRDEVAHGRAGLLVDPLGERAAVGVGVDGEHVVLAHVGEGHAEQRRDRRLADAALAGEHRDEPGAALEPLVDAGVDAPCAPAPWRSRRGSRRGRSPRRRSAGPAPSGGTLRALRRLEEPLGGEHRGGLRSAASRRRAPDRDASRRGVRRSRRSLGALRAASSTTAASSSAVRRHPAPRRSRSSSASRRRRPGLIGDVVDRDDRLVLRERRARCGREVDADGQALGESGGEVARRRPCSGRPRSRRRRRLVAVRARSTRVRSPCRRSTPSTAPVSADRRSSLARTRPRPAGRRHPPAA